MTKMTYFSNYRSIEELDKDINEWLKKNKDIEIITVGQSQDPELSRFTMTIFYKER